MRRAVWPFSHRRPDNGVPGGDPDLRLCFSTIEQGDD